MGCVREDKNECQLGRLMPIITDHVNKFHILNAFHKRVSKKFTPQKSIPHLLKRLEVYQNYFINVILSCYDDWGSSLHSSLIVL